VAQPVPIRCDDATLVARWRRDPESADGREAAALLLGRYRRRVYRWCHGCVRDHEAALDLAQDVMLSAHQKIGTLREGHRFGSWLYTVARNRCLMELRRRGHAGDMPPAIDPDQLPAGTPSPEDELLARLAEYRIRDLLAGTLTATERQAIVMRCFERMPVGVITEALSVEGASGARGLLQTARRKLRAVLAQDAGAFS
jgi:RNA polymerase sigma-70 factor (ECF subfamily)